ncbi:MAG: hypothetical protein ABIP51_00445 [Bacteroidia bacterium]
MKTKRACIYPKDIQRITGKSERYAQKLFKKIKAHYNRNQEQFLMINEFCEYTGMDQNLAEQYIID